MRRFIKFILIICLFLPNITSAAITNFWGAETGDGLDSTNSGTSAINSSIVHSGTYSWRVNPTTTGTGSVSMGGYQANGIQNSGATISTDAYVHFYFRYATKPSSNNEEFYKIDSQGGAGDKLYLRLNSTGTISVYDSAVALVATGATVLAQDTWYKISVRTGNGTTANYEVRINDVSELSGTADQRATNNRTPIFGKATNRNGNTVDFYYDTFFRDNSTFVSGTLKVINTLSPNGNGSSSGWAGGTNGADYLEVDETPADDDTTYVETTGSSQKELWALQDSSVLGSVSTIHAVKAILIAKESTTGTSACQLVLRSNTTENTTTSADWGATYVVMGKIYTVDPHDSGAWTTADLDTLEVGGNGGAATAQCRITRADVEVLYEQSAPAPTVSVDEDYFYVIE